jgi:UDP-galactopyranose mutase
LPKLQYRSINFHRKVIKLHGFAQPNSVVNYPGAETPFTRTVEYKHFLAQSSEFTALVSETTTDGGEPYYHVPSAANQALHAKVPGPGEAARRVVGLPQGALCGQARQLQVLKHGRGDRRGAGSL